MATVVLITVLVSLGMFLFLLSYIPAVEDVYRRISNGQWFTVGAERTGDVLNVDVTAHADNSTRDIQPAVTGGVPTDLGPPEEIVETPEVYLVQDGIYSYDEAEPLCRAYGSRLATMGDLYSAWQKGADWCTYGWVQGHKAVFPTQKASWAKLQESRDKNTRLKCGLPGLNGGLIRDKTRRFGVHCFGVKPPTWKNYLANRMTSDNLTAEEREKNSMTGAFRRKLNQYTIAPFSKIRWSDVYKTSADQQLSS